MEFFTDKRTHFPKGKIQVQTEHPFYEPGNIVSGVIYMEIIEPIEASHIEIEFKGGEKASFIRHYMETIEEDGEQRVEEREEKLKHSKKFLEYKNRVFDIQGGVLNPGIYSVNFQTELPDNIPSSLAFKHKHSREEPKAKVKYYIKAKLHTQHEHDEMKYKQVLIIREKPVALRVGEAQAETSNIKTWCCIDQGTSTMSSVFEKNVFLPTEIARGAVKVNNEHCQVAARRVSFFVEQVLTVRCGHHSHTYRNKLVEQSVDGPGSGQADWSTNMELDLSTIKYEVADMKKKKGVQKKISPEDKFMMAGVQAATHTKRITNEYFLRVEVEYDGCICCVDLPDSCTPLTIIPLVNPECFGFQPPATGWEPYNLGSF